MLIPHWKDPNRRRNTTISYKDPDYTKYYDLDANDFTDLVLKLKNNQILTKEENTRYGIYILTICLIVQEHRRFKNKPLLERQELIEQQYMELLQYITGFNPDKGKIYSYSYRIAYTAAIHYYESKKKDKLEQDIIEAHCREELNDYYRDSFITHKVEVHKC